MKNWTQKDWEVFSTALRASLPATIKEFKGLTAKDAIGSISAKIAIGATETVRGYMENGHFGHPDENVKPLSEFPKNFRV